LPELEKMLVGPPQGSLVKRRAKTDQVGRQNRHYFGISAKKANFYVAKGNKILWNQEFIVSLQHI